MFRILKYVMSYKKLLLIGTFCMLMVIGMDQISPLLQMLLVDDVIGKGKVELFPLIILVMCLITFGKSIMGFIKEYTYDLISTHVHKTLKDELFRHMETFELSYYDDMNTGELMSHINEDLENIWQTIGYGLRLSHQPPLQVVV